MFVKQIHVYELGFDIGKYMWLNHFDNYHATSTHFMKFETITTYLVKIAQLQIF